jgi:hypothetical protein
MCRGQSSESIPGLIKRLQIRALVAKGHKITNAPLILKIWDIIFLILGKLHNGPFLGIFRGGLDFFDPKIVPRRARDNLGVKKVLAPSKYPLKWPIM